MARATSQRAPDAIALLKADHRAVGKLFEAYEKARSKPRKDRLANVICLELAVHTTIEEEILYPVCKGAVDEDMLSEAYVEHDGAKGLIAELLSAISPFAPSDAKVKVLSEMIKHHVKEEEQRDGLFAQAKQSGADMAEIGQRLYARKRELHGKFEANGTPTPMTRSMHGEPPQRGAIVGP